MQRRETAVGSELASVMRGWEIRLSEETFLTIRTPDPDRAYFLWRSIAEILFASEQQLHARKDPSLTV